MINKSIYKSWSGMKQRCLNQKNLDYPMYGGRGIKVSKEWINYKDFERDMGMSWKQGTSLGRIDNNKGYFKDNCEWQNPIQQANNRVSSTHIEYKGEVHTLSEWCRLLRLNGGRTRTRYYCMKWSIGRCFTTLDPIKPTGRKY
jgi:hypothetical protein